MNIRGKFNPMTCVAVIITATAVSLSGSPGSLTPSAASASPIVQQSTVYPEKGGPVTNTYWERDRVRCTTNARTIPLTLGGTITLDGIPITVDTTDPTRLTITASNMLTGARSLVVNSKDNANVPAWVRNTASKTVLQARDWGAITTIALCDTRGSNPNR